MLNDWDYWANGGQREPFGAWRTWLFLGGRGAGKTRAGAEWVSGLVRAKRAGRIALIAPTFHDVREVMIEGAAGLRAVFGPQRPRYEASRRRLVWANGALAHGFSAEDPESLRGPQFDAAWSDELCFWSYPEETLAALEYGLRLGDPRMMATTTPRPIRALKRLIAAKDTVVTRATTFQNEANLSPGFVAALRERWDGAARQRQELHGELIEDFAGALWRRSDIDALRCRDHPPLDRIVVAVDPPASLGDGADACGIVAAGAYDRDGRRHAVVLADATMQGAAPSVWAARATGLASAVGALDLVAEANNGGEMVRAVLKAAAPEMQVRLVRASVGKRARAEPIAAYYAQGRVVHASAFPALEDEMCEFGAEGFKASPDRLDALVWALTDLFAGGGDPRARML